MNILYITSEAAPFCKTGGLADVLGSLPPAVAAEGDHTAVLLPLYSQIAQRWREKMNFRCYIYVDLGWAARILRAVLPGIPGRHLVFCGQRALFPPPGACTATWTTASALPSSPRRR